LRFQTCRAPDTRLSQQADPVKRLRQASVQMECERQREFLSKQGRRLALSRDGIPWRNTEILAVGIGIGVAIWIGIRNLHPAYAAIEA